MRVYLAGLAIALLRAAAMAVPGLAPGRRDLAAHLVLGGRAAAATPGEQEAVPLRPLPAKRR
jgi:hypothetical protein